MPTRHFHPTTVTHTDSDIVHLIKGTLCRGLTDEYPQLASLVDLMITNSRHTRAASTWRQYDPEIRRFVAFCEDNRVPPLGQEARIAALYLTQRLKDGADRNIGPQVVERASAAISVFHELAGLPSPCAQPVCASVRQAARRTLHSTPRDQGVATPAEILQLAEFHLRDGVPLSVRMIVTCAILAFSGLLRYDDLSRVLVHRELLRIFPDRVEICLYTSKTDQQCQGAVVTIGRIGGPFCPVTLLEALLQAGAYQRDPALRPIPGTSSWQDAEDVGPLLREVNPRTGRLDQLTASLPKIVPAMPYRDFREALKRLCYQAGIRQSLCPHDLRRGGASAAVANGADRMTVQKLGRWRNAKVFEFAYVRETASQLVEVTGRLGLRLPTVA